MTTRTKAADGRRPMNSLPVREVAHSGYRLVAAKPLVTVVWLVLNIALAVVMAVAAAVLITPSGFDPQGIASVGLAMLINLVAVAVMNGAAVRAVLRPDEEGLAYLRFGADEARLLVTLLAFYLMIFGVIVLVAVLVGILAALDRVSWIVTAFGVGLAALLVILCLGVKLSLAVPQTLSEQAIRPFNSWSLTQGNFWRLMGAFAWASIPAVALCLVIFGLVFASSLARSGGVDAPGGDTLAGVFSPKELVNQALSGLLWTAFMVFFTVPAATAYRSLTVGSAPEDVFGDD